MLIFFFLVTFDVCPIPSPVHSEHASTNCNSTKSLEKGQHQFSSKSDMLSTAAPLYRATLSEFELVGENLHLE